jgi:hypothetical protein
MCENERDVVLSKVARFQFLFATFLRDSHYIINSTSPGYNFYQVDAGFQEWGELSPYDVLILQTGPRYNAIHLQPDQDPEVEYARTIRLEAVLAKALIAQGKVVVHVSMPPVNHTLQQGNWSWEQFSSRNAFAQRVLEPAGVIFLDLENLLRARKERDVNVTVDHLHWCYPSKYDVPAFINKIIFQLVSAKLIQLSSLSNL